MKYTVELESDGKEASMTWEKFGHNMPGFPHRMGFTAITKTMENYWQDSCNFHVTKLTNFLKQRINTTKSGYGDLHSN